MRLRSRAGFSLVELLVALTILNAGLLALVAGSAAVVRRHNTVHARAAAIRAAAARIERLAAAGCSATNGASAYLGGEETWTVTSLASDVREVAEQITYAAPTGPATVALRSRITC